MNVQTHFEYICREGKYAHIAGRSTETLVITRSGNLPEWANIHGKKAAQKFWAEDEKNRDPNARGYREIRVALMEELSDQQNIELIETFLQRSGIKNDHVYSYAIHDKYAAFDKSHRNIHAHIMFNEKIIEHDRPLSADKFFKKYSTKKDGTAIGGYKVSRYFSSKEATISMRQLWEDIVNEKFKEAGIEKQISCKSLKDQKAEAEEEQNFLQATLLDREAGPKLGSVYRREKTMSHIQTLVKEFTESIVNPDKENNIEEYIAKAENDETEQSLILFAQNMALRNVAKTIHETKEQEVQQTRQQVIKDVVEKEKEEKTKSEQEAPWAITVQDMELYIMEKDTELTKTIPVFPKNNGYISGLTKERTIELAINQISGNKYLSLKEKHEALNKKYDETEKQEYNILQDKSAGSTERYVAFLKNKQSLKEEIKDTEEKLIHIETEVEKEDTKKKVMEAAETIWNKNENARKERLQALKKTYHIQAERKKLEKQINLLSQQDKFNVLMQGTIPIPVKTTLKEKIHGTIPLRQLPTYVKDGRIYVEIESVSDNTIKAVRIGDKTDNGNSKTYLLTMTTKNKKKKINTITETKELTPLFQSYASITDTLMKNPAKAKLFEDKLTAIKTAVITKHDTMFASHDTQKEKEHNKTIQKKNTDIQL